MSVSKLRSALAAVLLAALLLGGCAAVAPPAPTIAPVAQAPATQAPTATAVPPTPIPPTATAVPPTATPVPPTATPVKPTAQPAAVAAAAGKIDPKADPMAALLASGGMKSATFTYEMGMTMAPADDASAKALGPAADQLKMVTIEATGTGAMQVIDAAAFKSNMRMDMQMSAMGQAAQIQMILIGDTIWMRTGDTGEWTKTAATAEARASLPGMDPENLMKTFKDATKVKYLEAAQLDGEATHHLSFSMDPTRTDMSSIVTSATAGSSGALSAEDLQTMVKGMTIDAEVWLTAKDLQLRQERLVMGFIMPLPKSGETVIDARIKAGVDMTMKFENVNQPVKIEAPAAGG